MYFEEAKVILRNLRFHTDMLYLAYLYFVSFWNVLIVTLNALRGKKVTLSGVNLSLLDYVLFTRPFSFNDKIR